MQLFPGYIHSDSPQIHLQLNLPTFFSKVLFFYIYSTQKPKSFLIYPSYYPELPDHNTSKPVTKTIQSTARFLEPHPLVSISTSTLLVQGVTIVVLLTEEMWLVSLSLPSFLFYYWSIFYHVGKVILLRI